MATQLDRFFERLSNYIQNDEYKKALLVCNKILAIQPEDQQVLTAKCQCLIRTNQIESAVEIAKAQNLLYELAYCHYRNHNHEEALQVLREAKSSGPALLLLKAQILYQNGDYSAAAQIYDNLEPQTRNDKDLLANWLAAHTAAAELAGEPVPEEVLSEVVDALSESKDKTEYATTSRIAVEYNVGCAMINNQDNGSGERKLKNSARNARSALAEAGVNDEQIMKRLAFLMVQRAYALELAGKHDEAEKEYVEALNVLPTDSDAAAVATNNLLALRGNREAEDSYKRLTSFLEAVDFESSRNKKLLAKVLIAIADFLTIHGKNSQACDVYEMVMGSDFDNLEVVKLALQSDSRNARRRKLSIRATSKVSNDDAEAGEVDLEKRKADKKKETRRKKVMKARAKRRELFIKSKFGDEYDPEKNKPDPDRWIPKQFRKGGKFFKKRRGEKFTGGQGAGDMTTRGAQRLDAREVAVKKEEEKKRKEEERQKANEANKRKGGRKKKGKGKRR